MRYLIAALLAIPVVALAQTTYYSDANGMPIGTAQRMGNTTYYSNANGMPAGTAQQMGNTTYYSSANGMPAGTAQSTQPFQSAPIAPVSYTHLTLPTKRIV